MTRTTLKPTAMPSTPSTTAPAAPVEAEKPKAAEKATPKGASARTSFEAPAAKGTSLQGPLETKGAPVTGAPKGDALGWAAAPNPAIAETANALAKLQQRSPEQQAVLDGITDPKAKALKTLQLDLFNSSNTASALSEYAAGRKAGPVTDEEQRILDMLPEDQRAFATAVLNPTQQNLLAGIKELKADGAVEKALLSQLTNPDEKATLQRQMSLQDTLAQVALIQGYAKRRVKPDAELSEVEQRLVGMLPVELRDAARATLKPDGSTPEGVLAKAAAPLQAELDGLLGAHAQVPTEPTTPGEPTTPTTPGEPQTPGTVPTTPGDFSALVGTDLSDDEKELLKTMEPKDQARYLLQKRMQEKSEIASLLSNLQSMRHQAAMSIIGNIR